MSAQTWPVSDARETQLKLNSARNLSARTSDSGPLSAPALLPAMEVCLEFEIKTLFDSYFLVEDESLQIFLSYDKYYTQ